MKEFYLPENTKIGISRPSSMAIFLSLTYRNGPKFVTQLDFWDHFLASDRIFWLQIAFFFKST